ncbi:hypothetical protein [Klebsiella quasipneumoniae]|uniref:hypothetical protein n=1 Tax=Klebsiella quasipneumoniae TaxID=1463165 RepID=UPI00388F9E45
MLALWLSNGQWVTRTPDYYDRRIVGHCLNACHRLLWVQLLMFEVPAQLARSAVEGQGR